MSTREERKGKAVEIMEMLDIHKPYINGFKNSDKVCWYENFGGFWAYQDKELSQKIEAVESKYNCTVYAVTHEYTEFGELYSMLIVPNESSEWNSLVDHYEDRDFYAFAYVWNKDDDFCSEFGDVVVRGFGGGIKRIM